MFAETNRTPFDFSEGESELVSGFNVEYGSGGFILIFLAEYIMIFLIRGFICLFFISFREVYYGLFFSCLIRYFFILVRGVLPRFRYDKLINLSWKIYLPVRLFLMIIYL